MKQIGIFNRTKKDKISGDTTDGKAKAGCRAEFNNYDYAINFIDMCNSFECKHSLPFDIKDIEHIIAQPQLYPMSIRKLGEWAYNTNGAVKSGIDKMASMHLLSYVIYCDNFKKNKNKFLDYQNIFIKVLSQIKYKEFIRDAVKRTVKEGTSYYYFETNTNKNFVLKKRYSDSEILLIDEINTLNDLANSVEIISLPPDYCMKVGRKQGTDVIAFNLQYFNQFSDKELNRQLYTLPKEIRRAYFNYDKSTDDGKTWIILDWHKTIYVSTGATFKDKWGVPMAVTSLDEIMYANYFLDTKRGLLTNINNNLVYEVFPIRNSDGKSTLSEEQQKKQHAALKSAVTQKVNKQRTSVLSLAAGTEVNSLKIDTSLFDDNNESSVKDNIAESLGFSPSALYGGSQSSGANYATALLNLKLVASDVYTIIEHIVSELNKCINNNIIQDDKITVSMYILPITTFDKSDYFDSLKSAYADCGGAMIPLIASTGIDPYVYLNIMDYERNEGFDDKYSPHMSMYTNNGTTNSDTKEVGRKETTDLVNENTITSKNNNANDSPSP